MADPPEQPHQARDHRDLSGGKRRRRGGDGGTGGIDPSQSQRPGLYAEGDAAPLCVQPVQPQYRRRSRDRYNDEETKVIRETRKIFEDEKIAVGVTCVRVPVLRAHCEAITFECEKPITEAQVRGILATAPGVKIVDDRAKNYFPMPIDASGQDDVLVGRIRKDLSDASGHSISMFVAADQLLKGAALNAIQIAELLPQRVMA
jgi:aspartate-semialdehyde dehydrogenase